MDDRVVVHPLSTAGPTSRRHGYDAARFPAGWSTSTDEAREKVPADL